MPPTAYQPGLPVQIPKCKTFHQRRLAARILLVAYVVFGVLVPVLEPLGDPGLAVGSDAVLHVGGVVEAAYLLKHQLPPWDWMPDISGGHGGPNPIYYNAIGFIFPALLVNSGISPTEAIKIWIGLLFVIAALSAYLWCSLHGGILGGMVGASLYLWMPYLVTLPYVRGAYPEFSAAALYPLLVYLTHLWVVRRRQALLILATLVFATIIAFHTLSLVILFPFLCLYSFAISPHGWRSAFRQLTFLVGLTALLSATFIVGPLFERQKVDIARQFASADGYSDMGIPLLALCNARPLSDVAYLTSYIVPGRVHLFGFFVGAVSCLPRTGKRSETRVHVALCALALLPLLLSTRELSSPSVAVVPTLRFLQFPWRLLTVFNLFSCAVVARSLMNLRSGFRLSVTLMVPVVCCLFYSVSIPEQVQDSSITDSRSSLRASLLSLDLENKFLPAGAKAPKNPSPALLLSSNRPDSKIRRVSESLNDYRFEVVSAEGCRFTFHQYWFDRWKLEVDGKIEMMTADEMGLSTFELAAGRHGVRIYFGESWLSLVGKVTSSVTAACMILVGFVLWIRLRTSPR